MNCKIKVGIQIHIHVVVVIKIPAIDTWPITHLRNACKRNKIKGYTKMDREQLIVAVKGILKRLTRGIRMSESNVERLENMSPVGVDQDGNLLVKHEDWF